MTINYEPWSDDHKPRKFDRVDSTGRWSPLYERERPDGAWRFILFGCIMFAVAVLLMLLWGTT